MRGSVNAVGTHSGIGWALLAWLLSVACSSSLHSDGANPSREGLESVVAAHVVGFDPPGLPAAIVDRFAEERAVVVGEFHNIRQHVDLVGELVAQLHGRGTRLLLLEGYHAETWLANAWCQGQIDELSVTTEKYFGRLLRRIRTLNLALPESERVQIAFIDINHRAWAVPSALARLMGHRAMPEGTSRFLADIGWDVALSVEQAQELFVQAHEADTSRLMRAMAAYHSALERAQAPRDLLELVDTGIRSLEVRAIWETEGEHVAHPAREDVIHDLVERRLREANAAGHRGPVVLNVGGFHAQKRHVMGTEKVWLAERLAQKSSATGGKATTLMVGIARSVQHFGSIPGPFTLETHGPPGELFAIIESQVAPRAAYLPLDDPYFSRSPVDVNYLGQVVRHRPGEQFDAYILLPEGTPLYSQ